MELLIIPVFILGVIGIVALWTDRTGLTRWRGNERTAVGNALQTLNAALGGGEHLAALEYRKQVHDEEEHAGGTGPTAIFPGVRDDLLTIRPIRPGDGMDRAALPPEAIPAIIEESGQAVGYVQFRPLGGGAWCLQALSAPPTVHVRAARLLLAYLFEIEEAARVELDAGIGGLEACGFRLGVVTRGCVQPPEHRFSLRLCD